VTFWKEAHPAYLALHGCDQEFFQPWRFVLH